MTQCQPKILKSKNKTSQQKTQSSHKLKPHEPKPLILAASTAKAQAVGSVVNPDLNLPSSNIENTNITQQKVALLFNHVFIADDTSLFAHVTQSED